MKNYIETPILELYVERYYYHKNDGWDFCAGTVSDYFELPPTATHIQFLAYKEDKYDRIKVIFCSNGDDTSTCIDGQLEYIVTDTRDAIRKLRGQRKTWFVELYYWEQ